MPEVRAKARKVADLLRERPTLLLHIVEELRLPVPTCEGFEGPCTHPVLWKTPSQTRYEWDGEGEDPNAEALLCPQCSEGYTAQMDDQWAEYYGGLL